MNDWASAVRTSLWILFWGLLIVRYRGLIVEILVALAKRIKEGAPFKVGPGGLEVGWAPTPTLTEALQLTPNIGRPIAVIADSTAVNITKPLSFGSGEPIARIELGLGNDWWVTRLLVVCVRAARVGRPEAIVFTDSTTALPGRFIGWVRPIDLLDELSKEKISINTQLMQFVPKATFGVTTVVQNSGRALLTYEEIYKKAVLVTQALPALQWLVQPASTAIIHDQQKWPFQAPAWSEQDGPGRYLNNADFATLGPDALEAVLLDQIGILRIEESPDLLTTARLQTIAQHSLHFHMVDLSAPRKDQLAAFLRSGDPYVALTKGGAFQRLATTREVQQMVLAWLAGAVGGPKDEPSAN